MKEAKHGSDSGGIVELTPEVVGSNGAKTNLSTKLSVEGPAEDSGDHNDTDNHDNDNSVTVENQEAPDSGAKTCDSSKTGENLGLSHSIPIGPVGSTPQVMESSPSRATSKDEGDKENTMTTEGPPSSSATDSIATTSATPDSTPAETTSTSQWISNILYSSFESSYSLLLTVGRAAIDYALMPFRLVFRW